MFLFILLFLVLYFTNLSSNIQYFLCRMMKHFDVRIRTNAWNLSHFLIEFIKLFVLYLRILFFCMSNLVDNVSIYFNRLTIDNVVVIHLLKNLADLFSFFMLNSIIFEKRIFFYFSATDTPLWNTFSTILRFIETTSIISS